MEPDLPADSLTGAGPADGPSDAARREAQAGLYVHVPFCARRCSYCDFSTGSLSSRAVDRWLNALAIEVHARAQSASGIRFTSVFFGGGTPSALPPAAFRDAFRTVRSAFTIDPAAEITLEANPESVGEARLEAWAGAGVGRLSMGAQSFDGAELGTLGRIHDADRPRRAVALARAHGFRRLSLDLMFGFPGQTLASWERTLEALLELDPGHVSAYCFIPETGTQLGDAVLEGALPAADSGFEADLYAAATGRLGRAGYACYETSNFCRPDEEARHNLVYWLVRPYLGLGPSAHGFLGGERYSNHHSFSRWATALERGLDPGAEREERDDAARAREVVMLGLRLASGIRRDDYPVELWTRVIRIYGSAFERATALGRLERHGASLQIPKAHRFLADDTIAWIEARARAAEVDRSLPASLPLRSCPSLHSPAI